MKALEAEKVYNGITGIDCSRLQDNAIDRDLAFQKVPSNDPALLCAQQLVAQEPLKETGAKSMEAERIKEHLQNILKAGNIFEFNLSLERHKYLGFYEELAYFEDELMQMKENTKFWLSQVIDGWEISKSKILKMILEAQHLGLEELGAAAAAAVAAREREIYDNIELSINQCSWQGFHCWILKAKTMGIADNLDKFIADFKEKIAEMKDTLIQTASKGTKDEFSVTFRKGRSLGLDHYVYKGLQIVKKRIFRVIRRAIDLALKTSGADTIKRDWKPLEIEVYWLGISTDILRCIRTATGRTQSLTSGELEAWAIFKTDELGTPIEKQEGMTKSIVPQSHGLEFACTISEETFQQTSFASWVNSCWPRLFSADVLRTSELGVESCAQMIMDLPVNLMIQNWEELERLRYQWKQRSLLTQKCKGHANDTYAIFDTISEGCNVTSMPGKCLDLSKSDVEVSKNENEIQNDEEDKREEQKATAVLEKLDSQARWEQVNSSLLENNLDMNMAFSAPLVLTKSIIECRLNCKWNDFASVLSVDLSYEGLSSLGEGVLGYWCPRMKVFTADANRLTDLHNAFRGCEESLEKISLKENFISSFHGLEHLYNLEVLHLEGNCITQMMVSGASGNQVSGTRATLEVNDHLMREAQNKVLDKKRENHKHDLSLYKERTKELSNTLWPKLKELHLGCNRITNVFELGKLCPDLEVLDLGSNNIVYLRGTRGLSLAGLKNLRVLDVGQNKLQGCSLWEALKDCPLLVSLISSRNKITEIPHHFGSALLREIWLNGNAIKQLPSTIWMPNLQRLYLQDNAIDTLEPLLGCPSLEV
eukprot:Gb_31753 [translate_table: standard]